MNAGDDGPLQPPVAAETGEEGAGPADQRVARGHVRGSSLFLVGRILSLVANLVVQVLVVRYLSRDDFGAFSYVLSLVALGEVVVTLGIDRAVGRFLPIYEERQDWGRLFGTMGLVFGTILVAGTALVLIVYGSSGVLLERLVGDEVSRTLVLILVLLAPLQALDTVLANLFAVFASPRAIFFRKYLLYPAMRLGVVGLLVFGEFGVEFLAVGYVVTGFAGVLAYVVVLGGLLRSRGLLAHLDRGTIRLPWREILGYTIPLLSTDLVYLALNTSDVVILGHVRDIDQVAALRVVQPLAGLNLIVYSTFALLFTPAAARLFAREDRAGMRELYWQTAAWMAVLSFPIFLATFAFAQPFTVLLYEERYATSALILSLLALGRYVDAALGFNGLTLRVFGDMRWLVGVNVGAVLLNVALNLVFISVFGAFGAAAGTCLTLIGYNVAKQYALRRVARIPMFDRDYGIVYLAIVLIAAPMFVLAVVFRPSVVVAVPMVAIGGLAVLLVGRRRLRVATTFPELLRLPLMRRLLG